MQMTWRVALRVLSRRPMVSATSPPMPASISSKMTVGTGASSRQATSMARLTRESSPPEATFCRGWGGLSKIGAKEELDVVLPVFAGGVAGGEGDVEGGLAHT